MIEVSRIYESELDKNVEHSFYVRGPYHPFFVRQVIIRPTALELITIHQGHWVVMDSERGHAPLVDEVEGLLFDEQEPASPGAGIRVTVKNVTVPCKATLRVVTKMAPNYKHPRFPRRGPDLSDMFNDDGSPNENWWK